MNSYSFLASENGQNLPKKEVNNFTIETSETEVDGCILAALGDSYLRSSAIKAAQNRNYHQAIALLDQLLERNPQSAIDYNNRGLIYFQCGERHKALVDYNRAIELKPNLASAYNNRGNYYATCGELENAIADYDNALDFNPSYVRAWINRGITLRDLGQYDEAIEDLEAALIFGQLEANILAERGRTYHLWGDWNCAIADYRRALNLFTDSNLRLRTQVENWMGELLCP